MRRVVRGFALDLDGVARRPRPDPPAARRDCRTCTRKGRREAQNSATETHDHCGWREYPPREADAPADLPPSSGATGTRSSIWCIVCPTRPRTSSIPFTVIVMAAQHTLPRMSFQEIRYEMRPVPSMTGDAMDMIQVPICVD